MTSQSLSISKSESQMLSLLRVLAMMSIVLCHILQTFDNNYAWVFNVGVQVFLVLSGFLYGHKHIDDWKKWFIARFKKIYIPCLLFASLILIINAVTHEQLVTVKTVFVYILGAQGFIGGGIKSLGHYWFITAIILCYLITPILQFLRKRATICVVALLVVCLIEYYAYQFRLNYFSWVFLYSVGYLYPSLGKWTKYAVLFAMVLMMIVAMWGITWVDIRGFALNNTICHNSFGFIMVILTSYIGRHIQINKEIPLLKFLDSMSFYIYITHVTFVRPPFDVLLLSGYMAFNIVFALLLSFVSAYLLRQITDTIIKSSDI